MMHPPLPTEDRYEPVDSDDDAQLEAIMASASEASRTRGPSIRALRVRPKVTANSESDEEFLRAARTLAWHDREMATATSDSDDAGAYNGAGPH